ncbi:hypothetical protein OFEAOIEE_LOCUS5438 [Methylorubrum extorquens]
MMFHEDNFTGFIKTLYAMAKVGAFHIRFEYSHFIVALLYY